MSDGTPFLRVAADRIGAPGSARIAGKNAIPRHQRRQLVLNHPDRREDGCHSKANCTLSGFEPHPTGWEVSIWEIPSNPTSTFNSPLIKWLFPALTLSPHSPDGCRFGPVQVHDILAMTMG